jgi:hypothetical protein
VRLGQFDVEGTVAGARSAVGAGSDVGLAGEEDLGGGGHDRILSNDFMAYPI